MDPLSIIASSIAVAHGLRKSVKAVHDIVGAPALLLSLANDVTDLSVVLETLSQQYSHSETQVRESTSTQGVSFRDTIERCRNRLQSLNAEVKTWRDELDGKPFKDRIKHLKILRAGQKAERFKKELRHTREELDTFLAIGSA